MRIYDVPFSLPHLAFSFVDDTIDSRSENAPPVNNSRDYPADKRFAGSNDERREGPFPSNSKGRVDGCDHREKVDGPDEGAESESLDRKSVV